MPYADKGDRTEYQREYKRRYRAAPEGQAYRDAERRRLKERHARARRDRVHRHVPMPMPVHGPGPGKPLTLQAKQIMHDIYINSEIGCWLYSAYIPDAHGDFLTGRAARGTTRWIYEVFVGAIPVGSGIQRRCGRGACVNPTHLECRDYQAEAREIILPLDRALDRMRERFEAQIRVDTESDCWLWAGKIVASGYGSFRFNDQSWMAHRVAYTLLVGPIPEGLMLDHLCRNRRCVNPAHLEPVTSSENTRRGVVSRTAYPHEVAIHDALAQGEVAVHDALAQYATRGESLLERSVMRYLRVYEWGLNPHLTSDTVNARRGTAQIRRDALVVLGKSRRVTVLVQVEGDIQPLEGPQYHASHSFHIEVYLPWFARFFCEGQAFDTSTFVHATWTAATSLGDVVTVFSNR